MTGSVRYIWVIKLPTETRKSGKILFSRRFPTVEKKAKQVKGDAYTPVVSEPQLLPLLLQEVGLSKTATQFVPSRDHCDLPVQKPFYKLETELGKLWPIIALEKNNLLVCCLPFVEEVPNFDENETNIPFSTIPTLSLALALLCSLSDFLRVPSQDLEGRLSELPTFLNECAPFGQLRDGSVENVMARLANKACSPSKSHKVPAWKASSHKGKSSLQLSVNEYISASQCAQETWQDTIQVYGSVLCKAEFEGTFTDVSLNLSHQGDGLTIPLDQLIVHPCVQRADWQDLEETGAEAKMAARRVRFCPPLESFTLCHYSAKRLRELPVFGVYHMKPEEQRASVTVQLKLNDQIRNNFEFCELHIPFYTRSPISALEGTPTQGSISVASNKKLVIWNIGQKFTSKDQQVLLAATVIFSGSEQTLPAPTVEDAFCRGKNSYAQLFFKIPDFTHTGCCVDPKSVQMSPSTKFKLSLNRVYSSVDYKIWNSDGEGLTTKKGEACS